MNLHVPATPIVFDQTRLQFEPHAQRFNATARATLQGRSMTWQKASPRRSNPTESSPWRRAIRLIEKMNVLSGPRVMRRAHAKRRLGLAGAGAGTSLPAQRAASRGIAQLSASLAWLAGCAGESNVHVSNALSGLMSTAHDIASQEFGEAGVQKRHDLASSILVRALDHYLRTAKPAKTIDRATLNLALAQAADKLATSQVREQLLALSNAGTLSRTRVAPIVASIASKCFKPFTPPDGRDRSQAMSVARSLFIEEAEHALAYRNAVDLKPDRFARQAEQTLFRNRIASHFSTLDTQALQALREARPLDPHFQPVYAARILQDAKALAETRIAELQMQLQTETGRLPGPDRLAGNVALESLIDRLSGIGAMLLELRARGAETTPDDQRIDASLAILENVAHGETSLMSQLSSARLGTLITALKQLNIDFTEMPNVNAHRARRYHALAANYMQAVALPASQVTSASELATLMQSLNQHQHLADQADALRLDVVGGNGDLRGQAPLRERMMKLVLGSIQDPALRAMASHVDQVSMQHLQLQ